MNTKVVIRVIYKTFLRKVYIYDLFYIVCRKVYVPTRVFFPFRGLQSPVFTSSLSFRSNIRTHEYDNEGTPLSPVRVSEYH